MFGGIVASALWIGTIALVAVVAVGTPLRAQAAFTRVADSPLPRGFTRLRVIPSWTRFENIFAGSAAQGSSTVPLASVLASDSLGVAQISGLAPSEEALRTLTGDPAFRLSLGRSVSRATARIVRTALAAEFGLTRWLTLSALFPIVQTRTELFVELNADDATRANVGPNPARIQDTRPAAVDRALELQRQLGDAGGTLQTRLDQCTQNPSSDPNCGTILANRNDVISLIGETSAFASAVAVLFGSSRDDLGQPFAPLAGSATATAIQNRLTALTARLRSYIGSAADQIVATVPGAVGPAAFGDMQDLLLRGEFGLSPDSLGPVYRFNFGDIEFGAKLLVLERGVWTPAAAGPTTSLRTRLSLIGGVRLGTGKPTLERMPHRYLEYGTGDGQTDVEGGVLLDVGLGSRFLITAHGRYTVQLGEVEAGRVPDENGVINPFTPLYDGTRRLGDVIVGEVTPSFLLGRYFGADAHYAVIVRSDDEYSPLNSGDPPLQRGGYTEQRVGVGITYSTLRGARSRVPRVPVELSIAHIETITGSSAIVPRASRQQIELRLYYQLYR
jgi:hypothetical protein